MSYRGRGECLVLDAPYARGKINGLGLRVVLTIARLDGSHFAYGLRLVICFIVFAFYLCH